MSTLPNDEFDVDEFIEEDSQWIVIDYPGLKSGYQASKDGQIKSPKGHILKPIRGKTSSISVSIDGRFTTVRLSMLMLSAFLGFQEGGEPQYLDGNPYNCTLENLRWKTTPSRPRRAKKAPPRDNALPILQKAAEVQTYRAYRHDSVMMTVNDDGSGWITLDSAPTHHFDLTAPQVFSLTKVMARIGEMNKLMGVG